MAQDEGTRDVAPYRIDAGEGATLPLQLEAAGAPGRDRLCAWLRERAGWVQQSLLRHGALLLRGFDVADARGFEEVARAVAPALRADYLGTPVRRLTEHVFPASELPGGYPIAPHCEMSYLRTPPSRVFFGCLEPPARGSGETPLADFRRVWRALEPALRERFARGGIAIVRSFVGPASRVRRRWQLERWDEFFATRERAEVERRCAAEGIGFTWTEDDGLRLRITQPVTRTHPESGETVWYNQFAAHHLASSAWTYPRIFRLRPTLHHLAYWQLVRLTVHLKRRSPSASLAYFCTYADGSPIPDADVQALLDTIWRHTVLVPWQRGDVLAIDNRAIAHGRMPFRGPRRVVACLA